VEIGDYKGNKTIKLMGKDGKYGFVFGVKKAQMIVENFQAIKKFAEQYAKNRNEEEE
jgi:hypothetical protein